MAVANVYAESGADLVELGVPFSDPLAAARPSMRRRRRRWTLGRAGGRRWRSARAISERVPVVFMVYANMVLAHGGAAEFARLGACRGAAGAIVPDLPLGEAEEVREAFADAGLALVPLVAPTTPAERRARICAAARGFVYVVSTVGTTGERAEIPAAWPSSSPRPRPTPRFRSRSVSGSARRAGGRGRADRRRRDHRQPPRARRRRGWIAGGGRRRGRASSCARRASPSPGRSAAREARVSSPSNR